jgi:zinc protease
MIEFKRNVLDNGLIMLVHEDFSTPLVAMNIIYSVGSRDEDPETTGIAHLVEHLMFGGSGNIPDFDTPLQNAGADNNAFTNSDFTNYYLTIPANNIETGFWLESDRMNGLNFSEDVLDVQKKVVVEEFKQRYLNQPYGDIMMMLRPLAYRVHPYGWPTIGKDISHIEKINMPLIKDFFHSYYTPDNAILSLAGNIKINDALKLADKWFGSIKPGRKKIRNLTAEPPQNESRSLDVVREVPSDILYKAWHVGRRADNEFYTLDLLSDLLSGGESGRLYSNLVRDRKLLSDANAYLTGESDPGLMIISGKLMDDTSFDLAEEAINEIINELQHVMVPIPEMEKVKNKFESSFVFSNTNVQNKAMNIGFHELLGNADAINLETELYNLVDQKMVADAAFSYLSETNCSTLYYHSNNPGKEK